MRASEVFPVPARPGEEVGLPHLVVADRVAQRPHDRLLADDLVEVLRAVFPVERGHPGHRIGQEPGWICPARTPRCWCSRIGAHDARSDQVDPRHPGETA